MSRFETSAIPFVTVEATIAFWVLRDENFLNFVKAAGVDFQDFRSEARDLMLRYEELLKTNGRDYAVWDLNRTVFVACLEDRVLSDFPMDMAGFTALYQDSLNFDLTQRLISDLSRNPKAAKELVHKFLEKRAASVKMKDIQTLAAEWKDHFAEKIRSGTMRVEFPGFELLSRMVGGFNPGRTSNIVADTGFGKSNLGAQLALAASKRYSVVYVNMEMIETDMTERLLVAASGTPYADLYRLKDPMAPALDHMQDSVQGKSLLVTDGSALSTDQIEALLRVRKQKHGLDFVVVDYDQKIALPNDPRSQEWKLLQEAAEQLEAVAKSLNVHIMILCQANAEGGMSGSRRATFPSSTVLRFYQDEDDRTVIEAVKNRFGKRGATLEVLYEPAKALVKENDYTFVSQGVIKRKRKIDD